MDSSNSDERSSADEDRRWFLSPALTSASDEPKKIAQKKRRGGKTEKRVSWSANSKKENNSIHKIRSIQLNRPAAHSQTPPYRHQTPDYIDISELKPRVRPKKEKGKKNTTLFSRQKGRQTFLRFVLYPFFISWWKQRLSLQWLLFFLTLYAVQLYCVVFVWFLASDGEEINQIIPTFELALPLLLLVFDGALLGYTAASMPVTASNDKTSAKEGGKLNTTTTQDYTHVDNHKNPTNDRKDDIKSPPSKAPSDESNDDEEESASHEKKLNPISSMSAECCSASDLEMESSDSEDEDTEYHSNVYNSIQHDTMQRKREAVLKVKRWSDKTERFEVVRMTVAEIREAIQAKVNASKRYTFYANIGNVVSLLTGLLPLLFQIYHKSAPVVDHVRQVRNGTGLVSKDPWMNAIHLAELILAVKTDVLGHGAIPLLIRTSCFVCTLTLSMLYFNSVALAEETFRRRYVYAKYFSKLTSTSKSRRSKLPHFRLNKVSNIRVWLELRSSGTEINRTDANRAGDATANVLVLVTLSFVVMVGVIILQSKDSDEVFINLSDWVLMLWTTTFLFYIVRFSNLVHKTVKKLNPNALLMTEILNLQMLVSYKHTLSPPKLEEYNASLATLKVLVKTIRAVDANKDSQKKALLLNPMIYSLLRVTVLSAIGTVSSRALGFKVRLWKL